MLAAVWSMKGGVGVSTVAAALALASAERAHDTLLVDLAGDGGAVLGIDADGLGVADWCVTGGRSPDALARVEVEARPDLSLLGYGQVPLPAACDELVAALAGSSRRVVVDCGRLAPPSLATTVAARADLGLLVVRACYLTLRSARTTPVEPRGVILVRERGRSLGLGDVEAAIPAPVIAEISLDASIARAVDAGLVRSRLPRALLRRLAGVLDDA